MSKRRSSTRSGLFLIELIVAILFFSLASAICIQLFVKAHLTSNNSRDLSMALNQVQSVAESFKSSDGSFEDIKKIIGGEISDNTNEIILKFDSDWNATKSAPVYELSLSIDNQNPVTATVCVTKKVDESKLICKIETKKYIQTK